MEGDLGRYGGPAWDKEELGHRRLKPVAFTSAFIRQVWSRSIKTEQAEAPIVGASLGGLDHISCTLWPRVDLKL